MTQFNIVLKNKPEHFYIVTKHKHDYNVVLGDRRHSHDIYITNLTKKRNVDESEAAPLILHLTENNIDCFLYVDSEGRFCSTLAENVIETENTLNAVLQEHTGKLVSSLDTAIIEYLNSIYGDIGLSVSGVINGIASIEPLTHSIKIKNQFNNVSDIMTKVTEAIPYIDGSKMSVITACGRTYLKLLFDIKSNSARLLNNTESFTTTAGITDIIENIACLKTDVSLSHLISCLFKSSETCLNANEILSDIWIFADISEMNEKLSDEIQQDIRTLSSLDATFTEGLETFISDSLEAYYGLSHYDNEYLHELGDFTLYEMAAEL